MKAHGIVTLTLEHPIGMRSKRDKTAVRATVRAGGRLIARVTRASEESAKAAIVQRLEAMSEIAEGSGDFYAPRVITWRGDTRVVWRTLDGFNTGHVDASCGRVRTWSSASGTLNDGVMSACIDLAQAGYEPGESAEASSELFSSICTMPGGGKAYADFERWVAWQLEYRALVGAGKSDTDARHIISGLVAA